MNPQELDAVDVFSVGAGSRGIAEGVSGTIDASGSDDSSSQSLLDGSIRSMKGGERDQLFDEGLLDELDDSLWLGLMLEEVHIF